MITSTTKHRAIVRITLSGKDVSSINYSRRMYAVIRRYTPNAVEGAKNECFAELTGLRTFFKMTYIEMAENICKELYNELKVQCRIRVASPEDFENALAAIKKTKGISTYKEMSILFSNNEFNLHRERMNVNNRTKRVRLTVPFLGRVA